MNQSYCRFENTFHDLEDCKNVINETNNLSASESRYRKRLIRLCEEIIDIADIDEEE